jgi:hypothetical protein
VYFALLKSMDLCTKEGGLIEGIGKDGERGDSTGEGVGGYSEPIDDWGDISSRSGDLGE